MRNRACFIGILLMVVVGEYGHAQTTYYSRNGATPPRNWDEADSWTLSSDGSGAAAAIPGRADHVVILSGHDIIIDAVNDNGVAGVSPNSLGRANVGPFAGSADAMFYQTGNIIIRTGGFLTVTLEEIMIEGYTLVEGTFTISEDIVNLGYLEISAGATFSNTDDLILSGNSVTIMNNTSLANDDIYIDHTDALLCGVGVMQIGNGGPDPIINWNNPGTARLNQICAGFMITCMTNCTAGSTGTGTGSFSSGNRGPGGVASTNGTSELKIWLDASRSVFSNAGVTPSVDGGIVQQWSDQSGSNNHATKTTNTPTYDAIDPSINNGSAIDFSSAGSQTFNLTSFTLDPSVSSYTAIVAFNCACNTAANNNIIQQTDGSGTGRTQLFYNNAGGTINSFLGGAATTGSVYSVGTWTLYSLTSTLSAPTTTINLFKTGSVDASAVRTPGTSVGNWLIGSGKTGAPFWEGTISEMMILNQSINDAKRIIIENYISAKYNIPLTANDVYTMDDFGFDFEVAGIGQASNSTNHKDARGSGIVRIWNPSGLGNSEFLMWGHDNTALSSSNIIDVDGTIIEERLSRIWRVSETSDVGTITISFDISGLSGTPVGSNLRLLIDRDGDGFADNDVAPIAGSFANNTIVFSGINFVDGDRFTLGNTDLSFPLPIELISFEALVQNKKVLLTWITSSETNNDFFSIERSREGGEWNVIENIKGAGTSNQTIHYRAEDDSPLPKKSYYRLKQTDFDGHHQYSKVVQVEISPSYELIVSPNPTTGSIKVDTGPEKQPDRIVLFDSRGVLIAPIVEESTQGVSLNLESLPSGIYLLQVTIGLEVKSIRIVKN